MRRKIGKQSLCSHNIFLKICLLDTALDNRHVKYLEFQFKSENKTTSRAKSRVMTNFMRATR